MCGICGFATLKSHPDHAAVLRRMNETLRHRGPDADGEVMRSGVGLAMRRLAIIDLSTGHQPIVSESGDCQIVYNGELYNFQRLRPELESLGHHFRTAGDTEVILHAYEQWGGGCLHRLNGMFAFAIAESRQGRVFLARDRFGEKPLFYHHDPATGLLVFASEIKALLRHPNVPRRIDASSLPSYLAHGYVSAPRTMYAAIAELPPAHYLVWQGGRIRIGRYWDWASALGNKLDVAEAEAVAEIQRRLAISVKQRMISDVPLGAFLSGGVDSAAVVALMAHASDRPVKTFTLGFAGDRTFDETGIARLTALRYGTDHHEFIVEPKAIDLLPVLVGGHDQPFGDSSAIPMFLVSQLTRQHVTVALTGDGGDELFAGYRRFAGAGLAERYNRLPASLRGGMAKLAAVLPQPTSYNNLPTRLRRFTESAGEPLPNRYLSWVGLFTGELLHSVLSQDLEFGLHGPSGDFPIDVAKDFSNRFDRVAELEPLDQLLYVNATTYLPGDLLVKSDRMSMANSLELRAPFLDHELAEFVGGLPARMKLHGLGTKRLLKKAVRQLVPEQVLHRRKQGFAVPIGTWFRNELAGLLRETLLSREALARPYFRPEAIRGLVEDHQSGWRDHSHRLWALLTFELWHREYIDRPPLP